MQMLSDGERLILLTNQGALTMDGTYLTQSNMNVSQTEQLIHSSLREQSISIGGPQLVELNLSFVGRNPQFKEQKDFLLGRDLFRKVTITQLFKMINAKIDKR